MEWFLLQLQMVVHFPSFILLNFWGFSFILAHFRVTTVLCKATLKVGVEVVIKLTSSVNARSTCIDFLVDRVYCGVLQNHVTYCKWQDHRYVASCKYPFFTSVSVRGNTSLADFPPPPPPPMSIVKRNHQSYPVLWNLISSQSKKNQHLGDWPIWIS